MNFQLNKSWLALLCGWLGLCAGDAGTYTVTTTADSGPGSLRQAIANANTDPGPNRIVFALSGTPPFSISPLSALPAIGVPTTVDGTTQSGFTTAPLIELNGAAAGASAPGLQLLSAFNTVRGLAINRFSGPGIVLSGSSNVVQGCGIGTDVTGRLARGNTGFGLQVNTTSLGNLIGGTNAGAGNVIAGGNDTGIYLVNSSGNLIQGNLIGVAAGGTNALGNVNHGIVVDKGAGNWIGGADIRLRNVVSGNGQSGIYLNSSAATGNWIQGNYVGVDLSGSRAISNATYGIILNGAPANTVGGAAPGAGNVISGNGYSGLFISGATASNNLAAGNFIGTDATGRTALGNLDAGVIISAAAGNLVGGTAAGAANVISGNLEEGILLTGGASSNLVQGNLVGLSVAGNSALANGFNGISCSGAVSNLIGGAASGARNVISGNAYNGVAISQVADTGNTVLGNFIGTDVSGTRAIANTLAGVRIQGCSNLVGGVTAGSGNVISGNGQQGVYLVGTSGSGEVTGNALQGNLIGLDVTGANSLGNGDAGVGVDSAAFNLIGGVGAGARNVLSANGGEGLFLIDASAVGNIVQGNFIGTDATGTAARGNNFQGISLTSANATQIGGTAAGAGNLVSANNNDAVVLFSSSGNVLQGNFIGTKADGSSALGNLQHGVDMNAGSSNNVVAGNVLAYAQTFQGNGYCGARIRDGAFNNLISGNSIFGNNGLGIDLSAYGVTQNHPCESGVAANAANAGQNFPTLTSAFSGSGTEILGILNSGQNKTYLLQFFASPAGDILGYGEGQLFLGQTNLTLGVLCSSNFTVMLPAKVPAGWVVTATATDAGNNTSEFSAWIPVVPVSTTLTGGSPYALPVQHVQTLDPTAGGLVPAGARNDAPAQALAYSLVSTVGVPAVTNTVPVSSLIATNGNFLLTWFAPATNHFNVRWTTNPVPPFDWTTFADTITSTNGTFTFLDTNAPLLMKFYELILLP